MKRAAKWQLTCGALLASSVSMLACGGAAAPVQEPERMPDPSPIEYPLALWDRGVQGETEVMIHVNELGNVDSVLVSKPSGFAEFDSAAVRGALQLRFTPAKQGDRRVAMWTRLPVRFARDSAALEPVGSAEVGHE